MARPNGEIEAVRRVVREICSEAAPELDWERVEGELFEKLEREKVTPIAAARPKSRLVLGLAAAAAIAAGSFGVYRLASAPEPSMVAPAPRPVEAPELRPSVIEGDRLAAGARVQADDDEVRVEHPGRASWTLEPHGSAVIVRTADTLVIRLDSGAILARVVPAKALESFVVEVGNMRVAVHGTVFRVERRGQEAFVDVSEGAVAVGATTEDAARGWLLRAPARGKFTLDGKSGTVEDLRGARAPSRTRVGSRSPGEIASSLAPTSSASETEPPPIASAEPVAPARAELPSKLSIVELEDGISRLIDEVNGCFAQHTQTGGDMKITVKSSVTLAIAPDGRITSQRFAPPLAPTVQRCSLLKLTELRFAPSREGISVTRNIEFGVR